jgi:predicted DCC family thiol-disulfide oxidoreductase YuxK
MSFMAKATLFFDADCGFCQSSVEWILKRARPGTFDPVAYQDDEGMRLFPMVDRTLADKGIQALAEDGTLWKKASATAFCLTLVPGWRWLGHLILFPLVLPFASVGYAIVAANRQRISRWMGRTSCRIPPRA